MEVYTRYLEMSVNSPRSALLYGGRSRPPCVCDMGILYHIMVSRDMRDAGQNDTIQPSSHAVYTTPPWRSTITGFAKLSGLSNIPIVVVVIRLGVCLTPHDHGNLMVYGSRVYVMELAMVLVYSPQNHRPLTGCIPYPHSD